MPTLTITFSAEQATRVIHALCVVTGVEETPANAKQAVIDHIKQTVRNVERNEARVAAEQTLKQDVVLT